MLRVAQGPRALREVGRVGRRRPGLAILRHFAAAVEVVEQDELLGQRVLVRRDVAAEQRQARIAVALLQIAEHLIVGAVLFHDEEHVLDRRACADRRRNHGVRRRSGRSRAACRDRGRCRRPVSCRSTGGFASGVSMNEIRPFS